MTLLQTTGNARLHVHQNHEDGVDGGERDDHEDVVVAVHRDNVLHRIILKFFEILNL